MIRNGERNDSGFWISVLGMKVRSAEGICPIFSMVETGAS